MGVVGSKPHPFPRIVLKSRLGGEDMEHFAQDADAVVVGRCAEVRPKAGEIFGNHVSRHPGEVIDRKVAVFHPFGEVHPHLPLGVERRPGEVIAVRRLDVLKPHVRHRQTMLPQPERGEEPLQEPLRPIPILGARRPGIPVSLDAHPHCPPAALFALQIAHAFFPCHSFSFLLMG